MLRIYVFLTSVPKAGLTCLVVGMENINQLNQNVALFQNPRLNVNECMEIEEAFSNLPEDLFKPGFVEKSGGS